MIKQMKFTSRGRSLPPLWWDCSSAEGQESLSKHGLVHGSTIRLDLPLLGGMSGQIGSDKEVNIMVIGDKGVGKTSMLRNFLYGNKLNINQQSTKQFQLFSHHEKVIDGRNHFLNVYDLPGGGQIDESIANISKMKDIKDFHLFLFCYSLSSKKSLASIRKHYKKVMSLLAPHKDQNNKNQKLSIDMSGKFLIGCKRDLQHRKEKNSTFNYGMDTVSARGKDSDMPVQLLDVSKITEDFAFDAEVQTSSKLASFDYNISNLISEALNRFVKTQGRMDARVSRMTRNIEFRHDEDCIYQTSISIKAAHTIKDAVIKALKKMEIKLGAKSLETDILRWKIKVHNKYEFTEDADDPGKKPWCDDTELKNVNPLDVIVVTYNPLRSQNQEQ